MAFPSIFTNDGQSVYFKSSDSYSMPSCHIHNHNELLFVLTGRLKVESNLDTVEVDAPAVILHNSYTMHRAELLEGTYDRYVINFDDSTLDTVPAVKDIISFFKNANMTVIRLDDAMQNLLRHYVDRYSVMTASDSSQNLLTCMILCEIAKYRSDENTVRIKPKIPYINDVMHYISEHYYEPLTLEDLTARYYISRAKLVADFRNTTDMTVKQYTTLVRMNVARALLLDGVSVAEAARTCGYNNTSNFNTTFMKYFGASPAQYRKSVGSGG